MAIILEPSRELAQQTEQCIEDFSQYIPSPSVSSVCLIGGGDSRYQKQLIEEGVDIVVGTPGRLEDFINSGVLKLDNVRFLINLDEKKTFKPISSLIWTKMKAKVAEIACSMHVLSFS